MARILCISPYFPPRSDSEAFCGAKIVLEFLKRGAEATVLCLDPTSPYPRACDDSKMWQPLKNISINIPTPAHKDRVYSTRLALRYRAKNYARWIKGVVDTALLLHRKSPYDLVYSRSLPMEAHIAGYWISQRLNLPWIANINDPWDWHLMPEGMKTKCSLLYRTISSFWMRKTLRNASLVTYPSARLRDYHVRISGVKHVSEIMAHIGYRLEKKEEQQYRFSMVHAGKLGGLEMRSPVALLRGIDRFLRSHPEAGTVFRMTFVGQEDASTRARTDELGLRSVIEHTGRVSYERSLEYISSATVCVLVEGNFSEGIFLPSKLADYLAAGKPVLALSPGNGVIADLSGKRGLVRVDIDDENGVEAAIASYYSAFLSGRPEDMRPSEELIRLFEPDAITHLFFLEMEKITVKEPMRKKAHAEPHRSLDHRTWHSFLNH